MTMVSKTFAEVLTFTRASTATYVGSDGLIKTAAVDEARFTHDPVTLDPLGILIEESRTNLILQSEALDAADWTKSNTTVTADSIVSPNGASSADTIDFTASDSSVYQTPITVTAETNYTGSVYWKENSTPLGNYSLAFYDNSNSAFIEIVIPDIEDLANGWKRASYTTTTPTGCTSLRFYAARLTTGSTGDLYIWGAQLEEGSTPSSYIPTTDAAVTRAADNVSRVLGDEFNASEGTFYFDVTSGTDTNSLHFAQVSDDPGANALSVVGANTSNSSGAYFELRVGGAAEMFLGTGTPLTENTRYKMAVVYSPTGYLFARDGTVYSGGGSDVASLLSNLSFLGRTVGDRQANANGAAVAYYPYALTETELQELTS